MSSNPRATQPETRTLDENAGTIRQAIYDLARSGKVFTIDDVYNTLGSRFTAPQNGHLGDQVHANLLSAVMHGILERAGKGKGRSAVIGEDWVAGHAPKRRTVQQYRGGPRFRKESK